MPPIQEVLSTSREWKIPSLTKLVMPSNISVFQHFISLRTYVHSVDWNLQPLPWDSWCFPVTLGIYLALYSHHHLPNNEQNSVFGWRLWQYALRIHPYPGLHCAACTRSTEGCVIFDFPSPAYTHTQKTSSVRLYYFWPGEKMMQKQLKQWSLCSVTPILICWWNCCYELLTNTELFVHLTHR